MMEDFFTLDQAAKYLGISKNKLSFFIHQKEVIAVKIFKKWRLKKQDLDNLADRYTEVYN
jgi:excisionase family DNA binding protein